MARVKFEKGMSIDQICEIANEEWHKLLEVEQFLNEDGVTEMTALSIIEKATFWNDIVNDAMNYITKFVDGSDNTSLNRKLNVFVNRYLNFAIDSRV